jgi:hypothetical protein
MADNLQMALRELERELEVCKRRRFLFSVYLLHPHNPPCMRVVWLNIEADCSREQEGDITKKG